jgi:hypothetical protein
MGLLETLRSVLCAGRGCEGRPRREIDEKAEAREIEITRAQKRLERLLRAEEDLFRQGRDK